MTKQESGQAPSTERDSRWSGLRGELRAGSGSLDLVRVLQHLLSLLQKVSPDHAAGIFLLDEQTRTIQGQVTDLFDQELSTGEGALQAALHATSSFMISNLSGNRRKTDATENVRSQMAVPFRASLQVRGALVLRSPQTGAYSEQDGEALSAFAIQASGLIESALIHQRMLREGDGEMERDLVMAKEIMARLMPRTPPNIPCFDLCSITIPAKMVGGDLLDFIVLPDDHYGFLVADASGKGIPSARLMTGFRALFRGLIQNDFNIRSVFRKANQQLVESTATHQFVTAFYAALDCSTRRLIYVNGGNVAPLLYRPGKKPRRLETGGPVLGVLPEASFHEDSIVLRPNDILVFFSDGLSESENQAGDAFDAEKILGVVEKNREKSAAAICRSLQEEVAAFSGYNFHDDLTICILKHM